MKYLVALGVLIAIAASVVAVASRGLVVKHDSAPPPGIRVVDADKHLPKVLVSEMAETVEAKYRLENTNDTGEDLTYEGVSCGCTSVEIAGKGLNANDVVRLDGGEKADLVLRARLSKSAGRYAFTASFLGSRTGLDPVSIPVRMHVELLPDIVCVPEYVSHVFTKADSARVEQSIEVVHHCRSSEAASCVPRLVSLPPEIKVIRVAEKDAPSLLEAGLWKHSFDVLLGIAPTEDTALQANSRHVMVVLGNGSYQKETTIGVNLYRAIGIAAPKSVHFGTLARERSRTKRVIFRAADEREFQLMRFQSGSPAFAASAEFSKPRKQHVVDLTIEPDKDQPPGLLTTQITFETDHPDCPRINIEAAAVIDTNPASGGGK